MDGRADEDNLVDGDADDVERPGGAAVCDLDASNLQDGAELAVGVLLEANVTLDICG